MRRFLALAVVTLFAACTVASAGDYPQPSPYRIEWELTFKHGDPKRIVVETPGEGPMGYYYMTYTVTNNTGRERMFYPNFQLLDRDGNVHRSDRGIPPQVFDAIKRREGNKFLERSTKLSGELLLGEDQARDGVAIWREPRADMGKFSIFVGGLSGEAVQLKDRKGEPMKDKDGNPIILRKTLQLNYIIRGDEVYPGEDEVNKEAERWVMR